MSVHVLLVNHQASVTRSPNLGLGYLAAALEQAGHEVTVADVAQRRWTPARVRRMAVDRRWDLVGIQSYSCGIDDARRLARFIKERRPETRIVIGGRHVDALPEETLAGERAFDYALTGECEGALPELVARLDDGGAALDEVPNLYYRQGALVQRGPHTARADPNHPVMPAWHHIPPASYPVAPLGTFVRALPIAPIITSRGCSYRCQFCAAPSAGRSLCLRSPEAVLEEIRYLVRHHSVREIQILDDNFTSRKAHARAVCEGILRSGLKLALSLPNGVRLDRLDAELLGLLERAGCYSVTVGIESGVPRVLSEMKRDVTLDTVRQQLDLIRQVTSIRVTGNFLIGLPGETLDDIRQTIDFACSAPLHRAQFAAFLPLPGSPLFDRLRSEGKLLDTDFSALRYEAGRFAYVPDGMSAGQLKRALWRAFLRFYGRPAVLAGLAPEVRGVGHLGHLMSRLRARYW